MAYGEGLWDHTPLSAKEKRAITKEWQERVPELYAYKPGHLAEIIGPFAIEIYHKPSRDIYYPTLVIMNLAYEAEAQYLAWYEKFERMSRYTKEPRKDKMAELLRSESPLPWGKNLEHDFVMERLKEFFAVNHNYHSSWVLGLAVVLESYCGKSEEEIRSMLKDDCWYCKNSNYRAECQPDYIMDKFYVDSDVTRNIIEQQIVRFKMMKCPRYEIIY